MKVLTFWNVRTCRLPRWFLQSHKER